MTRIICDERSGTDDLDSLGRLVALLLLRLAVAGWGSWPPYVFAMPVARHRAGQPEAESAISASTI
jgi:hypothetical protein